MLGGAVGERVGRDDGEPPGNLPAARPGEQALGFDLDPGIDKRGREPFGEVLQLIGDFGAGASGQGNVVDFVDQDQVDVGVRGDRANRVGDVG
nr:hypothetical protein [Actinomadura sp. HBU206391]